MFKAKVIGAQEISFKSKEGEQVEFNKIYVTFKNDEKNSVGDKCAEINTTIDIEGLKIGENYEFDYSVMPGSKYPKLVSITLSK